MKIRLLIADDDALIRESLRIIFETDDRFELLAVCQNGQEAYETCLNQPIDVAVLDVRMPVMNGVQATKAIVQSTSSRVMILTTFDEDDYIKDALDYGAKGYLLKNTPPDQIKNAVVTLHGGNSVVQDVIMAQYIKPSQPQKKILEGLTLREGEVVERIAEGLTNQEIAKALFISEGTVKNTVSNILSKLELKHRTQIAIHYLNPNRD